nr:ribonuclease H-like domain-containing protein [Tanacetum cinerariifolium]
RTFMKRRLEEGYDLIENMTAHHNDWDTSAQRSESSSSITSSSDTEIAALKAEMAKINKNLMRPSLAKPITYMLREPIKANDAILKNMQTNMTSLTNSNLELKNMFGQFMKMNTASSLGSGTLPSNTITNPKEELKGITTRSRTAYQGPTIPTTSSFLSLVVECETEATKDTMHPTNNRSTKDVQPTVVQTETLILNSDPVVAPIIEPVDAHVSALKPNQRTLILPEELLIDVFEGELTLRVGKKAITFNLDQTLRNSDFFLEEVDAFLALEDDPTSPEVDQSYVDTKGYILLLKAFFNDDPSLPPPNQGNYLPRVRKELKICEAKTNKSLIDEPPDVELKDLPPHLEYSLLEALELMLPWSLKENTKCLKLLVKNLELPALSLDSASTQGKPKYPLSGFESYPRLQKLVSQLEIHGVSLSQEDVNFKFLYSLPYQWKTHTLIWRNKVNLEEYSLDDLFNSLKIYETKVRHSSSPGNPTQNLAFMSSSNTNSTTDLVSTATSVSDIDVDDLEEMDLRCQMTMLTMRARRFLQKTGINPGDNRVTTMGFDMSKVECYNCYRKGYFSRECRSPKDTRRTGAAEPHRRTTLVENSTLNALVSQCDGIGSYDWSYQVEEEPANFALMAITSSSSSSDNDVQSCSKACSKEYAQLHSQYDKLTDEFRKSQIDVLSYQVASQTNDKHGLGYFSSEGDFEILSPSSSSDRLQPSGGYHAVPPPITGTFMPPKAYLVFHTVPIAVETNHLAFTVQLSTAKPTQDLSHTTRPLAPIIEHWVFDSEDESRPNDPQSVPSFVQTSEHVKTPRHYVQPIEAPILTATPKPTSPKTNRSGKRKNRKTCFVCRTVRPVSAAVPKIMMTRPKHAHSIDTKSKLTFRRNITHSKSPNTSNSPPRVTTAQALVVSAAKGKKGKWLNGGYVAFGGNPKGGKISGKGKIKTGKLDFEDVYFVKELKFNIFSVSQICDKKNKVLFTDTKCLVSSPDFKLPDESQVLLRVPRENNMTPQQNGIAERKNRTLIKAAKTMLADLLLPIPFWAEAVNTACYVQNKVLVTKPHNKTPYEILHGRTPSIGFMRPFGCHVTILNTIDPLGKFEEKVDEGFLVGYSVNSKAFRVFNRRTLSAGNQSKPSAGFQETFDGEKAGEEANKQYMLFLMWSTGSSNPQNKEGDVAFDGKEHDAEKPESAVNVSPSSSALSGEQDDKTKKRAKGKSHVESFTRNRDLNTKFKDYSEDSTNDFNAAGPIVPTAGQNYSNSTNPYSAAGPSNTNTC